MPEKKGIIYSRYRGKRILCPAKPSFKSEQIKYIFRYTKVRGWVEDLKTFFIKSKNNPREKKWDTRNKRGRKKNVFII